MGVCSSTGGCGVTRCQYNTGDQVVPVFSLSADSRAGSFFEDVVFLYDKGIKRGVFSLIGYIFDVRVGMGDILIRILS